MSFSWCRSLPIPGGGGSACCGWNGCAGWCAAVVRGEPANGAPPPFAARCTAAVAPIERPQITLGRPASTPACADKARQGRQGKTDEGEAVKGRKGASARVPSPVIIIYTLARIAGIAAATLSASGPIVPKVGLPLDQPYPRKSADSTTCTHARMGPWLGPRGQRIR